MKCPILSAPTARTTLQEHIDDIDCLHNNCAWWDTDENTCCVKVLARLTGQAGYRGKSILNILPQGGAE